MNSIPKGPEFGNPDCWQIDNKFTDKVKAELAAHNDNEYGLYEEQIEDIILALYRLGCVKLGWQEDTGADPVGDGTFKMYPSGDIVDFDERNKRLPPVDMETRPEMLIGAKTAQQVDLMQGGKLDY